MVGLQLYQIILVIIAIATLVFSYYRLRSKKTTPATFVLEIILWALILLFAFKPDFSNPVAAVFGFGRGFDFLIIFGVLIALYLSFRLYIRFEDLNQQINELIRELAIRNEIELEEED